MCNNTSTNRINQVGRGNAFNLLSRGWRGGNEPTWRLLLANLDAISRDNGSGWSVGGNMVGHIVRRQIHTRMGFEIMNRLLSLVGEVGFAPTLLGTVAVLLMLQTFVFRSRRYLQYSHIPGPPTTGWSAWWLLYKCMHSPVLDYIILFRSRYSVTLSSDPTQSLALGGECHKVFYETNKKYGIVGRLSRLSPTV